MLGFSEERMFPGLEALCRVISQKNLAAVPQQPIQPEYEEEAEDEPNGKD